MYISNKSSVHTIPDSYPVYCENSLNIAGFAVKYLTCYHIYDASTRIYIPLRHRKRLRLEEENG